MVQVALDGLHGLERDLRAEDWIVLLPALERLNGVLPGAEAFVRFGQRQRWGSIRQAVEQGNFSYGCMCHQSKVMWWDSWRYGCSERLMAAATFDEESERILTLSVGLDSRDYLSILKENEVIQKRFSSSRNMFLHASSPALMSQVELSRKLMAQVRLLRMAGGYRLTGRVEALPDPFGTLLRSEVRGERLILWSLGRDGADNGGFGKWEDGERGPDLVLDIPR
jgi:hypothetical protein